MQKEIWKDVKGYRNYEISNLGRIRGKERYVSCGMDEARVRLIKCRILKTFISQCGYNKISIRSNDDTIHIVVIHRALMQAFRPTKNSLLEINHIDGNKRNNTINNLEWVTRSENIKHAYRIGLKTALKGEAHPNSILNKYQALRVKNGLENITILSKEMNVAPRTLRDIRNNKTWVHI